ncbi:hem-NO-binding protein [Marinomonas primoryensis]|uniref:Hem-NO-binding protein n=1 Tax=Marinomonas primoryensis TaxID=178399 RepID=A0A859CW13_9GAMM|nr:hem-NO-binding protein [Marinomonas primoryensis]
MKDILYNMIEEMVTNHFGMQIWNDKLDTAATEGADTAEQSYPSTHLFELVDITCEKSNLLSERIIETLGECTFHRLHNRNLSFLEKEPTLKPYLRSIESVIHV